MDRQAATSALEGLYDADFTRATADGLAAHARSVAMLQGQLERFNAQIATAAHAQEEAPPAEDLLGGAGRHSGREGKKRRERAGAIANMSGLGDALANGEASPEHADAVARSLARLNASEQAELLLEADEIVDDARNLSPRILANKLVERENRITGTTDQDRVNRQRRARELRQFNDENGMGCGAWKLDRVTAKLVQDRIRAAKDTLRRQREGDGDTTPPALKSAHLAADAFVALILGTIELPEGGTAGTVVVRDLSILNDDPADLPDDVHPDSATIDDVPIPPATAQRLLCDSDVWVAIAGARWAPLAVGRRHRSATPAQRAMLRALYTTCAVPGCDVPFSECHIHHTIFWTPRGRTDIELLVPVCRRDHHLIHDEGWRLELHADRSITLYRPSGEIHAEAPGPEPPWPDTLPRRYREMLDQIRRTRQRLADASSRPPPNRVAA